MYIRPGVSQIQAIRTTSTAGGKLLQGTKIKRSDSCTQNILTCYILPFRRVFGDPFGDEFTNTIGRGGPFPPAYNNTEPDPEFNAYSVRQIYEYAGDTSGKYTIPIIWDKVQKTIVNNDSSEIAFMLNSNFNMFAENPDLDLYTEDDDAGREKLTEVSEWLSPLMIHGVYRCGFAKQQREYDLAIAELCEAYDRCDDILQEQRYLTGDTLTDVDIRLFVSLIRFDEIYTTYFKANARLVMLTPSLLNFCRDIYQMPGIAETCDMDQIKAHFYGSHAEWNKYSVIPRGLGFMELLGMAHDRDEMSSFYEQQFVNDDDDTKTGNVGNQSSLPEEDTYTSEDDNEECPHNPSTTRVSEAGYLHMHTTNAESGDAFNPVGSNDEYQVYSSESELYQGSETLSGPMSQEDPA
jgi:putative glutathione S-transferase